MTTWPDTVPLKIRYGTKMRFGARSKVITEMEYGADVRRNRFTNVPYNMEIELHLTDEQYRTFLGWYTYDLLLGVRSFYAPVMTDIEIANMRCKLLNEAIEPTFVDYNRVVISLAFEIRGQYTISGGLYYLYKLFGSYDSIEDFADKLDFIVNEQYPELIDPYT